MMARYKCGFKLFDWVRLTAYGFFAIALNYFANDVQHTKVLAFGNT
jgi:hypothetical protein